MYLTAKCLSSPRKIRDEMTETHPFKPFLPANAKVLLLGSFPPKPERWCMDFYYPNFINDMWRITGILFFNDSGRFIISSQGKKGRFDKESIERFCQVKGIAMYDTATEIKRLKDNASDKYLEIIKPSDIEALLEAIPECKAIVTTGQKASEVIAGKYGCPIPEVGQKVKISSGAREIYFYRLPSTSRAYPLPIEKKAEYYRKMYSETGLL